MRAPNGTDGGMSAERFDAELETLYLTPVLYSISICLSTKLGKSYL